MPGSDELFGDGEAMWKRAINGDEAPGMFPNLQRQPVNSPEDNKAIGDMFRLLGGGYSGDPDPASMEKAKADAMRYDQKVYFKGTKIYTFDLSEKDDAAEYVKLRDEMYDRVRKKEYVVQSFERRYTEAGDRPRWMVHLEIHEYEYVKIDRLAVNTPVNGDSPHAEKEKELPPEEADREPVEDDVSTRMHQYNGDTDGHGSDDIDSGFDHVPCEDVAEEADGTEEQVF